MCTIITINQGFWFEHKAAVLARIMADASYNSEGWALAAIDSETPANDFRFNCMRVNQLAAMLETFFASCSTEGRMFLHARAATTMNVGIAYTHGFDNAQGTIIMHNGVIGNTKNLAVDSFNLTSMSEDAHELLDQLLARNERFANVLLITPDLAEYGVVRLTTGSLYTDGQGNYSTNPIATITEPVERNSAQIHFTGTRVRDNAPAYEDSEDGLDSVQRDSIKEYLKGLDEREEMEREYAHESRDMGWDSYDGSYTKSTYDGYLNKKKYG